MALRKKIYGIEKPISARILRVHGVHYTILKSRKPVAAQSKIPHFGALELKLELVRNQGDELRIGGLSLGVAHGVTEEALQGIQIPSVPSHFDGMTDGTFYPGRCGLEGLGNLGVEDSLLHCLWR